MNILSTILTFYLVNPEKSINNLYGTVIKTPEDVCNPIRELFRRMLLSNDMITLVMSYLEISHRNINKVVLTCVTSVKYNNFNELLCNSCSQSPYAECERKYPNYCDIQKAQCTNCEFFYQYYQGLCVSCDDKKHIKSEYKTDIDQDDDFILI
jgi:hypothetical protein